MIRTSRRLNEARDSAKALNSISLSSSASSAFPFFLITQVFSKFLWIADCAMSLRTRRSGLQPVTFSHPRRCLGLFLYRQKGSHSAQQPPGHRLVCKGVATRVVAATDSQTQGVSAFLRRWPSMSPGLCGGIRASPAIPILPMGPRNGRSSFTTHPYTISRALWLH